MFATKKYGNASPGIIRIGMSIGEINPAVTPPTKANANSKFMLNKIRLNTCFIMELQY